MTDPIVIEVHAGIVTRVIGTGNQPYIIVDHDQDSHDLPGGQRAGLSTGVTDDDPDAAQAYTQLAEGPTQEIP